MGSINSAGIYEYDVTDDEIGPVLLNRQSAALTALQTGRAQTIRVANVSQRAAALASHGTPTTSNPLIVFRADAGPGRELEYTTDGTTWRSLVAEEDTGWVSLTYSSGFSGSAMARKVGGVVTLQGTITRDTGDIPNSGYTNLALLPVGMEPSYLVRTPTGVPASSTLREMTLQVMSNSRQLTAASVGPTLYNVVYLGNVSWRTD